MADFQKKNKPIWKKRHRRAKGGFSNGKFRAIRDKSESKVLCDNSVLTVETSFARVVKAVVLAVVLTLVLVLSFLFLSVNEYYDYRGNGVFAICVIIIFTLFDFKFKGKAYVVYNVGIVIGVVLLTQQLMQIAYDAPIISTSQVDLSGMGQLWLGLACISVFYLLIFVICGKLHLSMDIGVGLLCALAVANHYVLEFRGEPLFVGDLLTAGTGMEVAGGYVYNISSSLIVVALFVYAVVVVARQADNKLIGLNRNLSIRGVIGVTLLYALLIFMNASPEKTYESWNIRGNQYLAAFCINLKLQYIPSPEGYSVGKVNAIVEKKSTTGSDKNNTASNKDKGSDNTADSESADETTSGDSNDSGSNTTTSKKPTVIAIMNESFSDLSMVGNFATNEDYMPFVHSLKSNSNAIEGKLYVDVFGGGTCNTEYSFLTGNSTALVPQNARPYQMYVDGNTSSLAKNLKAQGYSTYAMHPGFSTSWNRNVVYPELGFDHTYFSEDTFFAAPKTRNYPSDRSTYNKIIELYENRDGENPQFIFDVTIANHAGYDIGTEGLEQITLNDNSQQKYADVQEYLTLIKESDTAFKELVDYFSEQTDPVVIVFFGDHQPNLDENFYQELKGKPLKDWTVEELQQRYVTPYVIWSNYKLTGQSDKAEDISVNYLQETLLNRIGLQTTAYDDYEKEMQKQYPIIDIKGIRDKDGNYTTLEQALNSNKTLQDYQMVLYNNMFDTKRRNADLYNLNPSGEN